MATCKIVISCVNWFFFQSQAFPFFVNSSRRVFYSLNCTLHQIVDNVPEMMKVTKVGTCFIFELVPFPLYRKTKFGQVILVNFVRLLFCTRIGICIVKLVWCENYRDFYSADYRLKHTTNIHWPAIIFHVRPQSKNKNRCVGSFIHSWNCLFYYFIGFRFQRWKPSIASSFLLLTKL